MVNTMGTQIIFYDRVLVVRDDSESASGNYLSLKKKISPLICAIASNMMFSLHISMGVTGASVGGRGLSVGTPV